jgi:UDP-N-acetylmuramoyl-tripeptide--D-alanyl-D-alanine ligase
VAETKAFDLLICVGPQASLIADGALAGGFSNDGVVRFADAISACEAVPRMLHAGDLVLLKASRSSRLEQVAKAISQREQPDMRMVAS